MAAAMDFDQWLSKKLLEINPETDVEVFVDYIKGILADDESNAEEQTEYITDFLAQISEDDLDKHCQEIMRIYVEKEGEPKPDNGEGQMSFDKHLATAMEKNRSQVVTGRVSGAPQSREDEERQQAKAAILRQYDQVSDGEQSDDEARGGDADADSLVKNVNAKLVIERQHEERDKNKQDSVVKKQKDKEDKEKQKQKQDDRKDAEKKRTQKGEKRR